MQRCGKVNNTTIWWPKKTNETNRFKVKTWRGFDIVILKINQIYYKRIEVFTKDLTLNLMLPPVVTYWHDHMQALNSHSFSFWIYSNTSHLACDFEIPLKGFRSPSIMILMQQLCSSTLDCRSCSDRFLCS